MRVLGIKGRASLVLLAGCLFPLSQAWAGTVVLELSWDEMQATVKNGDFFPKVQVQNSTDPRNRVKGMLTEITETGIAIRNQRGPILLGRGKIHSIRLIPRKTVNRKNRNRAAILAVPVGIGTTFGTWLGGCLAVGGCPERTPNAGIVGIVAAAVTAPYLIYRLAWRKDRGSVRIILKNGITSRKEKTEQWLYVKN